MASQVITATDANRKLSEILNKVHYQHQSFDIKRGREVIARIVPAQSTAMPVSALNAFFKQLPALDESDSNDFTKIVQELRAIQPEEDPWG